MSNRFKLLTAKDSSNNQLVIQKCPYSAHFLEITVTDIYIKQLLIISGVDTEECS